MPRIPDEFIERIKQETDLAAVIRARGIALEKHGTGNLVGLCPFHDDKKTPNLIVTPAKGLYRCMSCGAAGNVIQFVEKFDGISFPHAVEVLAEGHWINPVTSDGVPRKKGSIPTLPPPVDLAAEHGELLEQVADYYHERLLGDFGEPGRVMLRRRGLDDDELIKTFRLGLADRSLGLRLPNNAWKDGKQIRESLKASGIHRDNGREHLSGCIAVPLTGSDGKTINFYGRKITPDGKVVRGAPKHLYLPGPHRGIFHPAAFKNRDVILCEAILDALTFWRHGIKNVTSTYGTEGFTGELLQALIDNRVATVRLAFDADDAGERATAKVSEKLMAHGIECHRIKLPWGEDVNSFALKSPNPAEALAAAVNGAHYLGKTTPKATPAPASSSLAASPLAADAAECSQGKPTPPRETPPPPANQEAAKIKSPSSLPEPQTIADTAEQRGEHWHLALGDRQYRIGGLERNAGFDSLKITLRLWCNDLFHLDALDLCSDLQRRKFVERAAEETTLKPELIRRDLGKILLVLEQLQEKRIARESAPAKPAGPDISPAARARAEELLQSPDLMKRIGSDFETCGMVGEQVNRLVAYLACTSRLLDRPLAVIIQSTSAAGKSTLMDAVLAMFPEEERIKYSAMTGQSLYYLGESNIQHKILAIVEEEGAERASYALKLLQSEGELTIASTGKNPKTGQMETQTYHVEGPVMIFLTTTAIDIDEELQNRCLTLTVDESPEQTRRIHEAQRKARTLEGILRREAKKDILQIHRDAQRLLEPYPVWNPYVEQLTFTSGRTRTRRDHEKYLSLIDAVTLLHQKQRRREVRDIAGRRIEALVATVDDIATANRLAPEVLGRSLDELPPQTRKLWNAVRKTITDATNGGADWKHHTFTRRQIREATGWSLTQTRVHLERLAELEYIQPVGGRNGQRFEYRCTIDPRGEHAPALIGLIDVKRLLPYDGNLTEQTSNLTAPNPHLTGGDGKAPPPAKPRKTKALATT
jgi:DNA primase catalytic core